MAGTFQINVVTPEAEVLDREVVYASIPAHDGQIGIQHLRAPLLVKLGYGPMKLEAPSNQGTTIYFVSGGFAQVKDNRLSVLTDQAILAIDLDPAAAERELDAALAMPTTPEDQRVKREVAVSRARAKAAVARG